MQMQMQIANRIVPVAGKSAMPDGATVELAPGVSLPALMMKYARNEEIFGEGEPTDFIYKVVEGAVRTVRILADGRRQVGEFYLPGDVFGIEDGAEHHVTAEAVGECRVALLRRSAVDRRAAQDASLARALWTLALRELRRAQDRQLVLGRKSALERVVTFLREMAERQAGEGPVELPMCRSDIADYLGLTIETVSRMLTQLERSRVIALPNSRTSIFCNARALERLDA